MAARYITPTEMEARDRWAAEHLLGGAAPPFSFQYGGQPARALLGLWHLTRESAGAGAGRTRHTATYVDAVSGLEARCEAVTYADFPIVEWTLHLHNGGGADTPVVEDVQALDLRLAPPGEGPVLPRGVVLHHAVGSPARADDYRPLETVLRPGAEARLGGRGGRPSDTDFPYTNLAWPDGGVLVVVGWPGQWAATFERGEDGGVHVRAGQERTRFVLRPGESVRGPLMVLQFYETPTVGSAAGAAAGRPRDRITAQNVWRRWMLAHNVPRVDGAVPPPFLTASSSSQFHEMEHATEENQRLFLDRYVDHGVPLDYWWMDAGWYATESGRWPETGTWEVDTKRFPRGLRGVADHAHTRGVKILVWFEPERVAAGTWLDREHPEWLLTAPGARSKLLDLGNPEALRWAIDHFDRLVVEQGVDLYRQDFNMPPLEHWRAADAAAGPHREGIAEIRHVTGYLAYWDELRRRHPGLLIDTCASGGRRNDLETLRRSVPLHVTDHDYADYTARQSLAYGLALWVPLYGTMVCKRDEVDVYAVRSAVGTRLGLGFDVRRPDLDWALLRRLVDEWQRTAPLLCGDFYPLTSYSTDDRDWIAFQHDRPEQGDGVVHVFRREASPYLAARFPLRGLDDEATYRVTDPNQQEAIELTGRSLMQEGLPVALAARPAAAVITYARTSTRT